MSAELALSNAPEEPWTEAQYEKALAHLERLQDMLDEVRCAIPNVTDTLLARPTTPRQLGENFLKATTGANGALSAFATAYSSDLTEKILAKSEADYEKDPNLILAYTLPAYGWATADTKLNKNEEKSGQADGSDGVADKEQDVASLLEEYTAKHAALSYQFKAGDKDIEIALKKPTVVLNFHITAENDASGSRKYKIDCLGSTQTSLAISRTLSSLPHYRNLRILLDLIVAYEELRKTPCVVCGSLLDKKLAIPVARRLKQGNDDSSKDCVFEAFHESCLP